MVPRIHKRGSSFKGACAYILHDQGKKTRDRVDWAMTQHLGETEPDDAWRSMRDVWTRRKELKALAGVPATGRDNTAPVLHYTLSWHKTDTPSAEHMQRMALETLALMGLAEHQAVIAAHRDKDHLHVHIVANTVHPVTGKTATLKYTKERLSKWAEAYEREHGIHCEERIRNNAERERLAKLRRRDPSDLLMGRAKPEPMQVLAGTDTPARHRPRPYVPVKHKPKSRKQWIEKTAIVDEMRRMRAAMRAEYAGEKEALWARHSAEREAVEKRTEERIDQFYQQSKRAFKPLWRNLYYNQRKEARQVERIAGSLFERAVYVFQHRDRLGVAGKPLTLKQMLPLIRSASRLQKRVADIHEHERRTLARQSKAELKLQKDEVWARHKAEMLLMTGRHREERARLKRELEERPVTFAMAKETLVQAREDAWWQRPFRPLTRSKRHELVDPSLEDPVRTKGAARPEHGAWIDSIGQEHPLPPAAGHAITEWATGQQVRRDAESARAQIEATSVSEPAKASIRPAFEAQATPPPEPAPELLREQYHAAAMPVQALPEPEVSRAEAIKRDMAAWRQRNQDKDHGREL